MILWILNFQGIKFEKYASGLEYPETLEFVKNQFQVEFVNENIPEFIAELHQECKNEGILRRFTKPSKAWENSNENIDLKELTDLLDGLEYDEVFTKLDALMAKNHHLLHLKPEVNNLRNEFVHGSDDYSFNQRLKTLIHHIEM